MKTSTILIGLGLAGVAVYFATRQTKKPPPAPLPSSDGQSVETNPNGQSFEFVPAQNPDGSPVRFSPGVARGST